MFECLEDADCCIREEAPFAENMQETIKLVLEGAENRAAAKYRKLIPTDHVSLGITCNIYPWNTIQAMEHRTAFLNRCIIVRCQPMLDLVNYVDVGTYTHRLGYLACRRNALIQVSEVQKKEEELPD